MKRRKLYLASAVAIGIALLSLPSWGRYSSTQLFSVVGADYVSPLIISPRLLQSLNAQLGASLKFAGYDQLSVAVGGPTVHLAKMTRYWGDLFALLGTEYLRDGRGQISSKPVFISESYWRRQCGQMDVVGRPLLLSGETYTIAGVVRTSEATLSDTDIWVPLCTKSIYGAMNSLRVIGEIAPGEDWGAGEKRISSYLHDALLREHLVDSDSIRLLPLDRKLVLYPSSAESANQFLVQSNPRKPKRAV